MKKLVIVGCGRLAEIVADAVVKGLLPDYDLVGVYSRTASKAAHIVHKMQQHGKQDRAALLDRCDLTCPCQIRHFYATY